MTTDGNAKIKKEKKELNGSKSSSSLKNGKSSAHDTSKSKVLWNSQLNWITMRVI